MEENYGGTHSCDRDVLVLGARDVQDLLTGQEVAIVDSITGAYHAHSIGESCVPHSSFVRFPDNPANRIIALPAYLGGSVNSAGVKWIASFPDNVKQGRDRASAVLILNSITTGMPTAILESSIISATRTAASAALAARTLLPRAEGVAGLIGCGLINFEIVRFLLVTCPGLSHLLIYDIDPENAYIFKDRCARIYPGLDVTITLDIANVYDNSPIISFATTATKPHVQDLSRCRPGAIVLHISLRDLCPDVILSSDNVVDDIEHVCKAETSIHLTERQVGSRNFVRCTLGDILNESTQARIDERSTVIFSPFGLGILDVAMGEFVLERARQQGRGQTLTSFFPEPWTQRRRVIVA